MQKKREKESFLDCCCCENKEGERRGRGAKAERKTGLSTMYIFGNLSFALRFVKIVIFTCIQYERIGLTKYLVYLTFDLATLTTSENG
jgi:hypothetical protein